MGHGQLYSHHMTHHCQPCCMQQALDPDPSSGITSGCTCLCPWSGSGAAPAVKYWLAAADAAAAEPEHWALHFARCCLAAAAATELLWACLQALQPNAAAAELAAAVPAAVGGGVCPCPSPPLAVAAPVQSLGHGLYLSQHLEKSWDRSSHVNCLFSA